MRHISAILVLMLAGIARAAPAEEPLPWTQERIAAVVRVEVTYPGYEKPGVSTGFIIATPGRYYAVVSTHGLHNETPPDLTFKQPGDSGPQTQCLPLEGVISLVLKRGDLADDILHHDNCAIHRERDISLIPLAMRPGGYPSLRIVARALRKRDRVYLAGYANGWASLDTIGSGLIGQFTDPPDELGIAHIPSAPGMSGGPYLWEDGNVVGFHRGGLPFSPIYAHFTRVEKAKDTLESVVGAIDVSTDPQPTPPPSVDRIIREIGVGDLQALALVAMPSRLPAWQELRGRKVTAEERRLIANLPQKTVVEEERITAQIVQAVASKDRGEIAQLLRRGAVRERSHCWEGDVRIAQGILTCDDRPMFLSGAKYKNPISPNLIVIHYTATTNLDQVVKLMTRGGRRTSTHFVIDRDGSIVQMVPTSMAARHAGPAAWRGVGRIDERSISIQLVGAGELHRRPDGLYGNSIDGVRHPENEVVIIGEGKAARYWHRFTTEQMLSIEALSRAITSAHAIEDIVGHCSISSRQRADPGPAFPLRAFGEAILGHGVDDCASGGRK